MSHAVTVKFRGEREKGKECTGDDKRTNLIPLIILLLGDVICGSGLVINSISGVRFLLFTDAGSAERR